LEVNQVRIKEYRERTGMTQEALADKLNVDRSVISYWERGKATPCKKHRAMLCAILQCTERELMSDAAH
jgi:transcriptional regulator with XRE-family HTH domain